MGIFSEFGSVCIRYRYGGRFHLAVIGIRGGRQFHFASIYLDWLNGILNRLRTRISPFQYNLRLIGANTFTICRILNQIIYIRLQYVTTAVGNHNLRRLIVTVVNNVFHLKRNDFAQFFGLLVTTRSADIGGLTCFG